LAAGSVKTDCTAVAALGPNAGSGTHFLPNPLVRITTAGIYEGVRLGPRCLEWILCVGRGDSRPVVV